MALQNSAAELLGLVDLADCVLADLVRLSAAVAAGKCLLPVSN
jgi:hypothetical protein